MNNYVELAKNFWADEDAFAEEACVKCDEEDCNIVCSLQDDDSFVSYSVDHEYKVTMKRDGSWTSTCEFTDLTDGEKIFWNHAAKLYATLPMWMVEEYRGIDIDEAAEALYDDDEDDYDIWGYDEDDCLDDEDWLDEEDIIEDEFEDGFEDEFEATAPWEEVTAPSNAELIHTASRGQLITGLSVKQKEDTYVSPFTGKTT